MFFRKMVWWFGQMGPEAAPRALAYGQLIQQQDYVPHLPHAKTQTKAIAGP
jgi:hypothetical protein